MRKFAWVVTSDIWDSRTQRVEPGVVCYCDESREMAERFAAARRAEVRRFGSGSLCPARMRNSMEVYLTWDHDEGILEIAYPSGIKDVRVESVADVEDWCRLFESLGLSVVFDEV